MATVNVNGIRAAQRRGLTEWLTDCRADVVALQEVRCGAALIPPEATGDFHVVADLGTIPGRNGVALLTRTPPLAVRCWGAKVSSWTPGGPVRERPCATSTNHDGPLARELRAFAAEGRYLEVDLAELPITVASLYLPKGGLPAELATSPGRSGREHITGPVRYARKMSFLAGLGRHLTRSRRAAQAQGRQYLVMGDFNIAHTRLDLRHWRSNQRAEGFLPEERAWLDEVIGPRRLRDVVRELHPGEEGPYSWWSWMGQAFERDAGWRIDYQLATPGLARTAVAARVDKAASNPQRISDHAPVVVDYDFCGSGPVG